MLLALYRNQQDAWVEAAAVATERQQRHLVTAHVAFGKQKLDATFRLGETRAFTLTGAPTMSLSMLWPLLVCTLASAWALPPSPSAGRQPA